MKINFSSPTVLRGTQQSTGRGLLRDRISDNACVMTLKSRAHIFTNHNHTLLTTQILRDQETAHHASRIRGCVAVENDG
jgi:hypothetical protein